jgi:signal transduction histidine kinase
MRRRRDEPILLGRPGSLEQLSEVSGLVLLGVATMGILGLTGVAAVTVLPAHSRPTGYHPLAIVVLSVSALTLALLGRRHPELFTTTTLAYVLPGTVLVIAAGAALSGPLIAPLVTMFFFWYASSVTHLPRPVAAALLIWVAVVHAVLLALQRGNFQPVFRWEFTIGVMVAAAVFVNRLVERSWALARAEQAARAQAERDRTELEVVNEQKTRFLARMSHELRTPLNAIIGFSEVLARRSFGELNPKQAEYVGDVVDSGRHLLALVDDILDVAKVETGTVELGLGPVEMARLLSGSLALFEEQAGRHRVTLHLDAGPELGTIEADARKLKQVMFNLLANALRFTPAGGHVIVEARRVGERVHVRVSDTGPGIAPEDREAIFEEFRQGTSGAQGGTGLGLPLARRLVELHGGRLGVESEVGAGSTFTAELPVQPRPPDGNNLKAAAAVDMRPLRFTLGEADSPERRAETAHLIAGFGAPIVAMAALGAVLLRVHPPPPQAHYHEGLFVTAIALALVCVVAFMALPRWLGSTRVIPYLGPLGHGLFGLTAFAMGPGLGDYIAIIYAWAGAFAFLILTRREVIVQLVLIGMSYGTVLAIQDGHSVPLLRWVVVMGFVVVTGYVWGRFVGRVQAMALAERSARDEAERVSAELRVASRHKTEFLANMSHELRTPLNAIIGFSEVLAGRAFGPLNAKQSEYVADVLTSGRHLLGLINDILDLTKAEAGHMELHSADVDVAATLASALLPFREDATRRGVDLRLEVDPGLGCVEVDEAKLTQALGHLVSNALRFTPDAGRVTLGAVRDMDHIDISVTDAGRGIDRADHERIFHAFAHGEESQGTGLGLALARLYAELHGGSLTVESDVGRGAVFTLRLPRQRAGAEAAAPAGVA